MTRRRLDLPERCCESPLCSARFKPVRRRQRFHNRVCRQATWRHLRRFCTMPAGVATGTHGAAVLSPFRGL